MRIREFWRRITSTRYTRALETEIALLRAENRALLNSILGIAGIPPIPVTQPDPCPACSGASAKTRESAFLRGRDSRAGAGAAGNRRANENGATASVAAPMRRRSWQQINRALEFESARKKPQDKSS